MVYITIWVRFLTLHQLVKTTFFLSYLFISIDVAKI